ncbi:hypothetical protein Bpfe_026754 [Biomphalaria pfeifferi]|uniref:Uncharacterized protein n=1 Tax=Biomphalaria pfeifferi TaxID=112525 RepID=A0AAD8EX68_BIOPF|nr:hypothetical protein Bpfe_026754 [Biomphalaria pfeifferi]
MSLSTPTLRISSLGPQTKAPRIPKGDKCLLLAVPGYDVINFQLEDQSRFRMSSFTVLPETVDYVPSQRNVQMLEVRLGKHEKRNKYKGTR